MSEDQPHPHPPQPDLEDGPLTDLMVMTEAVSELMIEKGYWSADDLRRTIEVIDAKTPANGARMIARAWCDADFKARMLEDVNAAAAELTSRMIPWCASLVSSASMPSAHGVITAR